MPGSMTCIGKLIRIIAIGFLLFLHFKKLLRKQTTNLFLSSRLDLILQDIFHSPDHCLTRMWIFDLTFFMNTKRMAFFLFKSFDLVDAHSEVIIFNPASFAKLNWAQKVQMRTFLAISFRKPAASAIKIPISILLQPPTGQFIRLLKVENTALFFDLAQSSKLANRLLLSYMWKGFKFDLFCMASLGAGSQFHATSASLSINMPKIKISNQSLHSKYNLYQGYLSEAKPDWAMQKGLLVSIAFPISVGK